MSKGGLEVADDVLMRRARGGDRAAFVGFAERWWPAIARFAWCMLGNASQAISVTEEVIGAVLESPQAPEEVPVGCFMYRLAIWLIIVRRRSTRRADPPESAVLQALDRLALIDRAAFLLRDIEQLSLARTAAVLEASEDEVLRCVHRSRIFLTGMLGDAANLDVGFDAKARRMA